MARPREVGRLREALPLRVLLPVALIFLLLWGFAELADEVGEGGTRALDAWVLVHLRARAGPAWLEETARDVTALGSTVVLGLVVVATSSYLALKGLWRTALLVLGSVVLGLGAIYVLKLGFDRPRPELVPHGQVVFTSSFPSGHAMGSALSFLTLAALLARVEPLRRVQVFVLGTALSLTFLVGVSRVYLGVHYPTDVVGGWGVGAAWAALAWLVADRCLGPPRSPGAPGSRP